MKFFIKMLMFSVGVAAIAIQFVPVRVRSSAPVTADIVAPEDVKSILRRSCYDCHSNETVWPLYSRVAPVSWWIGHHVEEGRRELNFSTWDAYSEMKRSRKMVESHEQAADGEMPPRLYLTLHPTARLSPADIARLREWSESVNDINP